MTTISNDHSNTRNNANIHASSHTNSTHNSNNIDNGAAVSDNLLQKNSNDPNKTNSHSSASAHNKDKEKAFVPPRFEIGFVCVVCFAQLLTQAGLGQSIAPLHIIGQFFGVTDLGVLSWFPAAYSLSAGTFILIAGRIGDIFNHKLTFILGFLWFGLWSIIAGLSSYSKSVNFFIVCRFFQGMGPAFVLPSGVAILGQTYSNSAQRKHLTFSAFGACAPGGFVLGAVFSSLFAQLTSWEYAYYVMGIVCVLVAIVGFFLIPAPPSKQEQQEEQNKQQQQEEEGGQSHKDNNPEEEKKITTKFDWLGSVVGVSALVLINVAFNQAPSVGWQRDYIIALIVIGVLLLLVFVYIELRIASAPLLPRSLFTREVAYVLGCISAGWSSFGIWVFYWWQFLEILRGQTPLLTTAQFSAVAISGAIASIMTGFLLHLHVKSSILMIISMCAFTLGLILFALTPVNQTYWALTFVSILIMPFGMDISFPAGNLVLSDSVPSHLQGTAASLVNTVLNYSISIGLGIAATVEVHVNSSGKKLLEGYRAAVYTGIALAGIGVLISLILFLDTSARPAKKSVQHE